MQKDIYDTPFYQARLIKQKKDEFINTTEVEENKNTRLQKQLSITLVKGTVEITYNSSVFLFDNPDYKISFCRDVNAFFIRNNFFIESIIKSVEVFTLYEENKLTKALPGNAFIYSSNSTLLESSESAELKNIITFALLRKVIGPRGVQIA